MTLTNQVSPSYDPHQVSPSCVGPEFDSRSLHLFGKRIFFLAFQTNPTFFSAKFPTFCRCASIPTKLSGKNPTFFVESAHQQNIFLLLLIKDRPYEEWSKEKVAVDLTSNLPNSVKYVATWLPNAKFTGSCRSR